MPEIRQDKLIMMMDTQFCRHSIKEISYLESQTYQVDRLLTVSLQNFEDAELDEWLHTPVPLDIENWSSNCENLLFTFVQHECKDMKPTPL